MGLGFLFGGGATIKRVFFAQSFIGYMPFWGGCVDNSGGTRGPEFVSFVVSFGVTHKDNEGAAASANNVRGVEFAHGNFKHIFKACAGSLKDAFNKVFDVFHNLQDGEPYGVLTINYFFIVCNCAKNFFSNL